MYDSIWEMVWKQTLYFQFQNFGSHAWTHAPNGRQVAKHISIFKILLHSIWLQWSFTWISPLWSHHSQSGRIYRGYFWWVPTHDPPLFLSEDSSDGSRHTSMNHASSHHSRSPLLDYSYHWTLLLHSVMLVLFLLLQLLSQVLLQYLGKLMSLLRTLLMTHPTFLLQKSLHFFKILLSMAHLVLMLQMSTLLPIPLHYSIIMMTSHLCQFLFLWVGQGLC